VAQRSPTTPRSRSLTPPRATRPSCNDAHSGDGEDGAAWIKRTASAAMLGLASLGVVSDLGVGTRMPAVLRPSVSELYNTQRCTHKQKMAKHKITQL
jgi:hypothetical protein